MEWGGTVVGATCLRKRDRKVGSVVCKAGKNMFGVNVLG